MFNSIRRILSAGLIFSLIADSAAALPISMRSPFPKAECATDFYAEALNPRLVEGYRPAGDEFTASVTHATPRRARLTPLFSGTPRWVAFTLPVALSVLDLIIKQYYPGGGFSDLVALSSFGIFPWSEIPRLSFAAAKEAGGTQSIADSDETFKQIYALEKSWLKFAKKFESESFAKSKNLKELAGKFKRNQRSEKWFREIRSGILFPTPEDLEIISAVLKIPEKELFQNHRSLWKKYFNPAATPGLGLSPDERRRLFYLKEQSHWVKAFDRLNQLPDDASGITATIELFDADEINLFWQHPVLDLKINRTQQSLLIRVRDALLEVMRSDNMPAELVSEASHQMDAFLRAGNGWKDTQARLALMDFAHLIVVSPNLEGLEKSYTGDPSAIDSLRDNLVATFVEVQSDELRRYFTAKINLIWPPQKMPGSLGKKKMKSGSKTRNPAADESEEQRRSRNLLRAYELTRELKMAKTHDEAVAWFNQARSIAAQNGIDFEPLLNVEDLAPLQQAIQQALAPRLARRTAPAPAPTPAPAPAPAADPIAEAATTMTRSPRVQQAMRGKSPEATAQELDDLRASLSSAKGAQNAAEAQLHRAIDLMAQNEYASAQSKLMQTAEMANSVLETFTELRIRADQLGDFEIMDQGVLHAQAMWLLAQRADRLRTALIAIDLISRHPSRIDNSDDVAFVDAQKEHILSRKDITAADVNGLESLRISLLVNHAAAKLGEDVPPEPTPQQIEKHLGTARRPSRTPKKPSERHLPYSLRGHSSGMEHNLPMYGRQAGRVRNGRSDGWAGVTPRQEEIKTVTATAVDAAVHQPWRAIFDRFLAYIARPVTQIRAFFVRILRPLWIHSIRPSRQTLRAIAKSA